jgi:signal transduction histidine kinase
VAFAFFMSAAPAAIGALITTRQELNTSTDDYDLPSLITRARAAGLAVDLDVKSPAPLPPPVARAAFRVVQEALTNVTKHAPGATVQVTLTRRANRVQVTVVNTPATPPAAPPTPSGTGLHGLSERVRMLGSTLTATRTPDGGFAVEAALPVGRTKVGQKDSTFGGSARNSANA